MGVIVSSTLWGFASPPCQKEPVGLHATAFTAFRNFVQMHGEKFSSDSVISSRQFRSGKCCFAEHWF